MSIRFRRRIKRGVKRNVTKRRKGGGESLNKGSGGSASAKRASRSGTKLGITITRGGKLMEGHEETRRIKGEGKGGDDEDSFICRNLMGEIITEGGEFRVNAHSKI